MQESFHTLLRQWEVKPAHDPNFRANVWRKIAERKQRLSFRIWSRTEQIVGQPTWATVVIAVFVLAGSWSGNVWRQHSLQEERAEGLNAYVLAVDPVAHVPSSHR